jgi:hypothetical protein
VVVCQIRDLCGLERLDLGRVFFDQFPTRVVDEDYLGLIIRRVERPFFDTTAISVIPVFTYFDIRRVVDDNLLILTVIGERLVFTVANCQRKFNESKTASNDKAFLLVKLSTRVKFHKNKICNRFFSSAYSNFSK